MNRISEILGYDIAPRRGALTDLNAVGQTDLVEARRLAGVNRAMAARYLVHLVRRATLDNAAKFVDEVVVGGATVASWGFRDLLVVVDLPTTPPAEVGASELVRILHPVDGDRWWRVVPDSSRLDWSPFCGAPGVLVRSAPYWWEGPSGSNWTTTEGEQLERVSPGSLEDAVREWVASRVSWETRTS